MRALVAIAIVGIAVGIAAVVPVDHPLSPFGVVHAQTSGGNQPTPPAAPNPGAPPTGSQDTPKKTDAASEPPKCPDGDRSKADDLVLTGMALIAALIIIGGVASYFLVGDPLELTPVAFFWLGMVYTVVLLAMAALYQSGIPIGCKPYLLNGILPIAIPWFGALGAVTISLEGVFLWNQQWEKRFNYWHIGRPIFGAVLGTVAFFLFVVIVSAAGSPPTFLDPRSSAPPATAKDFIVFYVVAFLVGYRESTFRDLIKRATDLILKPDQTSAGAAPGVGFKINGAPQTSITFAAGDPTTKTLQVENSGTAALLAPITVTITPATGTPPTVFGIARDQVSGAVDLAPQQMRTVDITFTPPAPPPPPPDGGAPAPVPGVFHATLSVTAKNLTAPRTIAVSA
jgi:hypothetical protein